MNYSILPLVLILLALQSCEYSPFDTDVKSIHYNNGMIDQIKSLDPDSDTIKFAVLSDSHETYDELDEALSLIGNMADVTFVICNGDVTNEGYAQEFLWYLDIIKKSKKPVVTVIGNHDCLANGERIFQRIFGPVNNSFLIQNFKFVLFNNVIWENNLRSPAYIWLEEQLADTLYHNIVIAHVPPLSEDVGDLHRSLYKQIVRADNTILGIYSSAHSFSEYSEDGLSNFITAAIFKREFYIVKLYGGGASYERIKF